jgi:hypothetical protein
MVTEGNLYWPGLLIFNINTKFAFTAGYIN